MFEVYYANGSNGYFGYTSGKLISDGNIFVVEIWNDDNSPSHCIFVNAANVFPKSDE